MTTSQSVSASASESARVASVQRQTRECTVDIRLNLDGSGRAEISTGLPFLDHLLTALALHARIDVKLSANGDLHVCDHHTVEDVALALGEAVSKALGDRAGIARFGHAYVPLDEALARAVIDLSGRPWPAIELRLRRERIGAVATENLTHFLSSFAIATRAALHVEVLAGANDHHQAEAAWKALAVALRQAVRRDGGAVPSTKGVL
jgi:imidazoleglycerol phosphate dehydratase HisB